MLPERPADISCDAPAGSGPNGCFLGPAGHAAAPRALTARSQLRPSPSGLLGSHRPPLKDKHRALASLLSTLTTRTSLWSPLEACWAEGTRGGRSSLTQAPAPLDLQARPRGREAVEGGQVEPSSRASVLGVGCEWQEGGVGLPCPGPAIQRGCWRPALGQLSIVCRGTSEGGKMGSRWTSKRGRGYWSYTGRAYVTYLHT